jgi:dephospho-CoA kinase
LARVPFVGLTGGLGAGKSTALDALERLGAATLSTDAVVHELYASPELRDVVVARWGEEVAPGGVVDRGAIAAREPVPAAAVVETPLLFEAGMDAIYDATVAVVADEAVRSQRAAARGHVATDERAARQLPQEEKARRATYTVSNSGTVEELERELSGVLASLKVA